MRQVGMTCGLHDTEIFHDPKQVCGIRNEACGRKDPWRDYSAAAVIRYDRGGLIMYDDDLRGIGCFVT